MRKHPDSDTITRSLRRSLKHTTPWKGEVFRATSVRYANRDDLLTGLGAKTNGGRWNPQKSFATIYTSSAPETALAEYLAQHRYFGWPVSSAMPYVMVAVEVSLQAVLDLTAGEVRKTLAVSERRMLDASWRTVKKHESLTQAIGRSAFEAELEAVVVPSSAHAGGKNLIVFPENLLSPDSRLKVINREQLPPPPGVGD